jgi:drug/metabolite transporter (DMT)-like permease
MLWLLLSGEANSGAVLGRRFAMGSPQGRRLVTLIVASVLCQLGAVLLLKQLASVQPLLTLAGMALHPLFLAALACMGMQALIWQRVLAKYPLSFAYPLNSIIYPASLISGWLLFGEAVTTPRLMGSAVILFGVWIMFTRRTA